MTFSSLDKESDVIAIKRYMLLLFIIVSYFLSLQNLSTTGRSAMVILNKVDQISNADLPSLGRYDFSDVSTDTIKMDTSSNSSLEQAQLRQKKNETRSSLSIQTQQYDTYSTINFDANRFGSQALSTSDKPDNENTVIALIAMGTARQYRLAERCIRSIRASGKFTGYILLFTDEEGYLSYNYTMSLDPKTIVVEGLVEDMNPVPEDGRRTKFTTTMVYQRFKTLVPKYISFYPDVDTSAQYILYLDIDNVVAQDLTRFFEDYHSKVQDDIHQNPNATVTNHSYISFWKERKHFQGGQFIAHRKFGKGCLDAWRTEFDHQKSRKDQPLLMNVYNKYEEYHCSIFTLPFGNFDRKQRGKHFQLFTSRIFESSKKTFPTIVHITGLRTRLNSEASQREFLRKALVLENITDPMMIGNISWEEVLTPVGPKGHRPPTSTSDPNATDGVVQIETEQNFIGKENEGTNDSRTTNHVDFEKGEQSTQYLKLIGSPNELDFTIARPTDNNTVIALVAMGNAAQSLIAERCIRTIRSSGSFDGYILLFTDDNGYEEKANNLSFDSKVIVTKGREEDLKPADSNGKKIKYFGKGIMIFKRFKTLVLRYLDYDSRFDDIRYALYLDVDNIVTNKLSHLFDDYATTLSTYLSLETTTEPYSYFSFWKDPGMKKSNYWQGGQIMYDRYKSVGCVDAWRNEMDTVWGPQDQPLLMNVYNNFTRYGCKVYELPDPSRHFTLLTNSVVKGKDKSPPTLVHITTVRAKKFMGSDMQGKFIRNAMHVYNETEMMTETISWYDVSQPTDGRGRKPKPKPKKK